MRRVLTYAPTSSTEWTPAPTNWFVPNWFVDVTSTIEHKIAAFACYGTEARDWPHPALGARAAGPRGVLRRLDGLRGGRAVRARAVDRVGRYSPPRPSEASNATTLPLRMTAIRSGERSPKKTLYSSCQRPAGKLTPGYSLRTDAAFG